ncbi:hypothetical protein [Nitrosomonas sp.]|uniref:hypothetical protein n=1 Tax=Nitrosomonas sp. TaxID=42353 RepID=UPI00284E36C4|nr:hypothetical protein [Nitrosomonas sp.]MDR4514647.1 hypothetical protein [Nitrosomonas sp.]
MDAGALELNFEAEETPLKELAFAFEENDDTLSLQRYPSGNRIMQPGLLLTGIQAVTGNHGFRQIQTERPDYIDSGNFL